MEKHSFFLPLGFLILFCVTAIAAELGRSDRQSGTVKLLGDPRQYCGRCCGWDIYCNKETGPYYEPLIGDTGNLQVIKEEDVHTEIGLCFCCCGLCYYCD